jgi:hypothetical protein
MTDVLEKLRSTSRRMRDHLVAPLYDEAADEIETLRKENDRLERAIELARKAFITN